MICAAAEYAEDSKREPPRELVLMWECQSFPGALPEPGGLLVQPAGLIARMRKAHQVWSAFDSFSRARSWRKWSQDYPGAWKLKCWVDTLRQAQDRQAQLAAQDELETQDGS